LSTTLSIFFFSSRRRHTRFKCDWSSDVCSSDLGRMRARQRRRRSSQISCPPPIVEKSMRRRQPVRLDRHARALVRWSSQPSAHRSEERRVGKECRRRGGLNDEGKQEQRYGQLTE